MKNYLMMAVVAVGLLLPNMSCVGSKEKEPIQSVVERGLETATAQALNMAGTLENQPGRFPKSIKEGKLETSDYSWWCCGFFPGELWYLYENTPTDELKHYAELFTGQVEKAKDIRYSHDLGFMLYCSFGNGYRLTSNPAYRDILLAGAESLYSRYNPHIGLIRSWDFNKKQWQYPVIIDNMMNLEFMMWAGKASGKKEYCDAAISHAEKTMKYHFRKDYSTYHVVSYDTITGLPHKKQTHQGYSDESSWSRGQGWALYGYTMMYRESGREKFLTRARDVAHYLMNHPRMPEDKVPYWDFDAPDIPDAPRDASAAALMASALIELGEIVGGEEGGQYIAYAEDQVRSLTSDKYLSKVGENCNFSILHCTGSFPAKSEVDVPLSYGDYYYVEALIRLKHLYNHK